MESKTESSEVAVMNWREQRQKLPRSLKIFSAKPPTKPNHSKHLKEFRFAPSISLVKVVKQLAFKINVQINRPDNCHLLIAVKLALLSMPLKVFTEELALGLFMQLLY